MKGINHSAQKEGGKILWGLSIETYQPVSITESRRGAACDCICPGCHHPLVAHKGEDRAHHFKHAPDEKTGETRPCANPAGIFETLTHLWAKEYIKDTKRLVLPEAFIPRKTDPDGCEYKPYRFIDSARVAFDEVVLEPNENDFRPDCIGYKNGKRILIEIYVTHAVEPEKREKIKKSGDLAVEICLNHHCFDPAEDHLKKLISEQE